MTLPRDAMLLRIFISEQDKTRERRPLYEAIVMKARNAHLAGATVLRGPMGFGHSTRLHSTKILDVYENLPLVVEIVDTEDKIKAFLPTLAEMMPCGLVTLEKVQALQYRRDIKSSLDRLEMDLDTIRRQDGLGVERPGPSTMSRETMAALDERLPSALSSLVAAAKASIGDPSPGERVILAKLDAALARTEEGRLRVAMLGQFKRGKSTLLNALLGVPLLPTGITPVTAIPTYVHAASSPLLRIEFEGSRAPLESREPSEFSSVLARYVAEAANANNREQVRSVEISLNSATFSDRVILVDTPGVGSTFLHNSRTAEAVLGDCDVGIFVLSPDPPITEVELGYLDNVQRLVPKVISPSTRSTSCPPTSGTSP